MVSNARDISNISRYSIKSWAHIAFSANILNEKTNLVVLRPGLYAAWDVDMTFLKWSNVLPMTIIARIFLRTENKMTGLRFFTGSFGLFGFGNGIRCLNLISSGYLPVSATWLRISAIYWSGLYLINSVFSCDQAAIWLVQSVCLSVCPSHLFDYVTIMVSSWNFQELSPSTRVRSMQKVKVRGQRSRSQRSQPNLTVSGL